MESSLRLGCHCPTHRFVLDSAKYRPQPRTTNRNRYSLRSMFSGFYSLVFGSSSIPVPPESPFPATPAVTGSISSDTGVKDSSFVKDKEMLVVSTSDQGALAGFDLVKGLQGDHNNDESVQDSESFEYSGTDGSTLVDEKQLQGDEMDLTLVDLVSNCHSLSITPPCDSVPLEGTSKRFPDFEWTSFASSPPGSDEVDHDIYDAGKILEWIPKDAIGDVLSLGDDDSKESIPSYLEDLLQLRSSSRKRPRMSNDSHLVKTPTPTSHDEGSRKRMRLYTNQTCSRLRQIKRGSST